MVRGLYSAASGMSGEVTRTEVIANNLANASTPGFKRDVVVKASFPAMFLRRLQDALPMARGLIQGLPAAVPDPRPPVGPMGTGSGPAEVVTDLRQGNVRVSSNPLDLSLAGPGFFVLAAPAGPRYTRAGNFSLDSEGYLVGPQGYRVMGRLLVVDFPDPAGLVKEGASLFAAGAGSGPAVPVAVPAVTQGALEMANVETVKEMVSLVEVFRAYEASQRAIQSQDQTLARVIDEVGDV